MATFTPLGLYKEIACPGGTHCKLFNCIFLHKSERRAQPPSEPAPESLQQKPTKPDQSERKDVVPDSKGPEPPAKRRRVEPIEEKIAPPARQPALGPATRVTHTQPPNRGEGLNGLASLQRPVEPPLSRRVPSAGQLNPNAPAFHSTNAPSAPQAAAATPVQRRQVKKESLNPRHVIKPPDSHQVRLAILTRLHKAMVDMNKKMVQKHSADPKKKPLIMSDDELVAMALDEEEKMAKDNPLIYKNVIKLRIVKLSKMSLEDWMEVVSSYLGFKAGEEMKKTMATKSTENTVETGLTNQQEIVLLRKFIAKPEALKAKGGFVLEKPTNLDIEEAKRSVELTKGWERCERCHGRFQVFPGRREDGLLTTGGPCTYHPLKPVNPRMSKTDFMVGHKEARYPCCNEPLSSSAGCTRCDSHVWKTTSPARLAAVLQFEKTPEPPADAGRNNLVPITFDCEMSYTTLGMELVRLTAVTWPDHSPVLDVLVRPYGEMLDFNTRFSGVTARHFLKSYPYNTPIPTPSSDDDVPRLPAVESPAAARALLFQHLRPSTPLIGHGIENDLNACRIIHPSIVDTALLYPHPRGFSYSLKTLARTQLSRQIQTGSGVQGAEGHDSLEDAVATGELVRVKIRGLWSSLRVAGWRFDGNTLVSPQTKRSTAIREGAIPKRKEPS